MESDSKEGDFLVTNTTKKMGCIHCGTV